MPGLIKGKITKRDFLKMLGLSSASLLAGQANALSRQASGMFYSGFGSGIPVVAMIKPNAFRSRHGFRFTSVVVLPEGYKASHVDASSVTCGGAPALDSICDPDNRMIAFAHRGDDLDGDLPGGTPLKFGISGRLLDGDRFEGSDTVMMLDVDGCHVYHTSSRKRRSCNACRRHAANRIYSSRQFADIDKAHPGCNCRIVEEEIGWQDYARAFWHSSQGGNTVYDRRWDWPPSWPQGLNPERPLIL